MDFMEMNGCWTHTQLRHWWNFGYEAESILRILRHLPQRLSSSIHRLLSSLHFTSEYSTYTRQHMSRLVRCLPNADEMSSQGGTHMQLDDDEVEWENEQVFALIGLDFDPSTQIRTNVRANSRAALLWNLRKSEFLLRFANYDLQLPYTEIDWLRVLVLDLRSYFQNVTSHYHRMMVGSGMGARAMLVCVTKIKTFNGLGRISQVSHVSRLSCWFEQKSRLTRGPCFGHPCS
jgi:hypothetical protein